MLQCFVQVADCIYELRGDEGLVGPLLRVVVFEVFEAGAGFEERGEGGRVEVAGCEGEVS